MKKFIVVMLVLVLLLGVFSVGTFAATYGASHTGVNFTRAYQDRYGNGIYFAFYYPEEGDSSYLSTDVSTATGIQVKAQVRALGVDGTWYNSQGLVSTNGGVYITAEVEPSVEYVQYAIHTASRTKTTLLDDFSATYD